MQPTTAGCIGLYNAGYVGVKVPNERHGSLFKHQREYILGMRSYIGHWELLEEMLHAGLELIKKIELKDML